MRQDNDFNDDLSDLIGRPSKMPVTPPATYQAPDFNEPCKKCRGTGRFISYSGRMTGQCFACKGAGKFTFKTSQETRAKARQNAAAHKAKTAKDNVEAFTAAHPEVAAWIKFNPTFSFAVAMGEAIVKFGDLTPNQMAACERCVAKALATTTERTSRIENAPEVDVSKIEASFAAAIKHGIKRPKLRLDAFQFSLAPSTGKNAGSIYVKEGEQYLGKVTAGKFMAVRECGDERAAKIIEVASNPATSAKAFGLRTGSCSCCGRTLTKGESIDLGIGPICASKFGW